MQKIREKLDRLGPINLAAIHEHQELDERYRFLTTQEQDLSTSIGSLKEIIQRINRTTKDMFAGTFAELQQKFSEVFVKFFPGGRAELQLVEVQADETTEGRGPQEPGVDIVVQPPGKRLKSITMLSGGEKTLTAMALLFASFLIRPTPFCILDEIDAPLDEENIGRFTGVLHELSEGAQFMVITHSKADDGHCRFVVWGHDGRAGHLKNPFGETGQFAAGLSRPDWLKHSYFRGLPSLSFLTF